MSLDNRAENVKRFVVKAYDSEGEWFQTYEGVEIDELAFRVDMLLDKHLTVKVRRDEDYR